MDKVKLIKRFEQCGAGKEVYSDFESQLSNPREYYTPEKVKSIEKSLETYYKRMMYYMIGGTLFGTHEGFRNFSSTKYKYDKTIKITKFSLATTIGVLGGVSLFHTGPLILASSPIIAVTYLRSK